MDGAGGGVRRGVVRIQCGPRLSQAEAECEASTIGLVAVAADAALVELDAIVGTLRAVAGRIVALAGRRAGDRLVGAAHGRRGHIGGRAAVVGPGRWGCARSRVGTRPHRPALAPEIGRASCRERVCQYYEISVVCV